MKKILSVMLAIMMLFGAMSISASAVEPSDMWGQTVGEGAGVVVTKGTHLILVFNFGEGKSKGYLPVYDSATGKFTATQGVTGSYVMLPQTPAEQTLGAMITMPSVQAPDGQDFIGWYCYTDKDTYYSGEQKVIGDDWFAADNGTGVVYLTAQYEAREPETDTMAMVLGVLTKVFGTIIGILFLDGSSSAGIELVNKLLGGLL